ncbi:MAG: P-II family nitrogen regulator [Nitrososphaeraceae archaeon]
MNEEILSSSSLPYEVKVQKEGESAKDHNNTIANKKKRIEAIIPSEKTDSVLSTLESMNIQATFYESKGMGKGEKYMISYGKGGKTTKMPYSIKHTVVTIIDENKVGEVINAIRQSAKITSQSNVGIIIISSVDDILTM